jgi:hypothetical protein
VVAELREGWAVLLPSGHTLFFMREDVRVVRVTPWRERGPLDHSWLLASLLWPGAGQLAYGAFVERGPFWERHALVTGGALAVAGFTFAALSLACLAMWTLAPALLGQRPSQVLAAASILALSLSFVTAWVDAAMRVVLTIEAKPPTSTTAFSP